MKHKIRFAKMHGLGNDFMVINNMKQAIDVATLPVTQLGDRHLGVGFDQLLLVEPGRESDFFIRIFNADGSEAEQCGNGLRCVARYVHEEKLYPQKTFTLATKAGVFPVEIEDYDRITVAMGLPQVQEKHFELMATQHHSDPETWSVSAISMGNPHAILKVHDVDITPVDRIGTAISKHPYFEEGANVGFMQIMGRQHVRLRTFERGTGETLACGSNACAAAVAAIINGWADNKLSVEFSSGTLEIAWRGQNEPIYMTGPACLVFSAEMGV